MVCPKCGTDIPEGRMYCPKCGEAIQMVPDFEPDLEDNLAETRNNIAGSFEADDGEENFGGKTADLSGITKEITSDTMDIPAGRAVKSRKNIIVLSAVLLCIILITVSAVLFYSSHTYSAHMERAASYMTKESYTKAAGEYEAALARKADDIAAMNGAAEALSKSGDQETAVNYLNRVISIDNDNETAYNLIISIYKERGDYTAINKLIASCSDDAVFDKYSEYLALPPEFSEEAGKYDELFDLALSTDEANGTIYYTTDGSTPGKTSKKYTKEISLKEGSNVISAVCINTKGFVSATVTNEYDIVLKVPDAPAVTPESGSFSTPEDIKLTVSGNDRAYYTTDGTDPTDASLPYSGELPMPFGESSFAFIIKSENGKMSDVTRVNYQLNYVGVCRPEEAVNFLLATLINDGSILDIQGHVAGSSGQYTYRCDSCTKVGSRVYYMIDEYYTDPGAEPELTGTQYALDSTALGLYKASRDKDGGFVFEMFY